MSEAPPKNVRRKPSQERSLATCEALIEATARVLVEEGYDRLSTNRVAAVAGVSIGSLYQYYPNKEALVGAVLTREMASVSAVLRAAIAGNLEAPLPVFVSALVEALLQSHRENVALRRVMMEQVPRLGLLGDFEDHVDRLTEVVLQVLRARGDRVRPADLELACFVLVHAVAGATRATIYRRPNRLHHAALSAEISALALRYLQPEPGEDPGSAAR